MGNHDSSAQPAYARSAHIEAPPPPPLPDNATPEEKDAHWFKYVYQGDHVPQLTVRAVVMGGLIGMAMCCAHLYTVLAIGWSFGVAITACVMSYVIWNLLRVASGYLVSRIAGALLILAAAGLSVWLFPRLSSGLEALAGEANAGFAAGGICALVVAAGAGLAWLLFFRLTPMSILENNCMQSTASAAGYSTGSTLATCFGALLLLTATPANGSAADVKTWDIQPIWLIALFTLFTGCMGVFLAIPLKRQMINHEQLPFPSGVAAATTLRSLYSHGVEAMRKAYALVIAMLLAMVWGVLRTDHTTASKITFGADRSLQGFFDWVKEKLVIGIQVPDQIPAEGFYSLHGKQLFKFAFEPSFLLIAAGMIVGLRVSLTMLAGSALLYFVVGPYLFQMDMDNASTQDYVVSIPLNASKSTFRITYWSLWGGTALMVCASLTSLALQWKTVVRSFTSFGKRGESPRCAGCGHSWIGQPPAPRCPECGLEVAAVKQPDMSRIEVPTAWFLGGIVPISIAIISLLYFAFDIHPFYGLLAVGLSFVLSMVAARSAGETDTTPTGAMGKVMQLVFAGLTPGKITPNLISAGAAANSASAASDLLMDLKSGYLLGANPRKQFLAQFIGVFFGTVAILPCWYLMVPDKATLDKFSAPATRQWQAVAELLTKGVNQLPHSAVYAIMIGAIVGIALPLIERTLPKSARAYFPSAMGLGLSWVIPFSNALSFAIGAAVVWLWGRVHSRSRDGFNIPIASGLIAGESLAAGMMAMLATAIGLSAAWK